jgi:GNAT superfamily N-acetyltransferase
MVKMRMPRPHEGERLREIAVSAKAHWGYEMDRVKDWAAKGDFSAEGMAAKHVYVAEVNRQLVGWAAGMSRGEVYWLDDLWIEPPSMRQGVGRRLFRRSATEARRSGARRMEWEAERHAIGFYEKMGGRYLRESGPGTLGRVSPVMGLDLG